MVPPFLSSMRGYGGQGVGQTGFKSQQDGRFSLAKAPKCHQCAANLARVENVAGTVPRQAADFTGY
jgi:hypothetical protein